MKWGNSSRAFLALVFLLLIICSAILPVLGLRGSQSISSYGTISYSPFLRIINGNFYKNGQPFVVRSHGYGNALAIGIVYEVYEGFINQAILESIEYGFTTIRTWATGTRGEMERMYDLWSSNREEFFRGFDAIIERCKTNGVYLIIVLGIPHFFTRVGTGDLWDPSSGAYALYREYVLSIASRYRDETQILLWEIINEWSEYSEQPPDKAKIFYQHASSDIKIVDPNHLISTGSGNVGYNITLWKESHNLTTVDITSFHLYEGEAWDSSSEETTYNFVKKIVDISHKELGKPLFFGEFGADMGFDAATKVNNNPDNPVLIWILKSIINADGDGYNFHAFYSGACDDIYSVVPEQNLQIIAAFKHCNK